ncbi:uncharacterized protein [Magallana gigas]
MAIRCIKIYVSAIQISCVLLNADFFVSSVCLEDIPLFIRSNKACEFRTVDFDIISNDSTKGCHIDCSILSTDPPSSHMDSVYKILTIEVNLLFVSNGFNLQTQCINRNPSLNIRIGCEGEFIHNRGIRERCDSDTQCENGTTNSFCNETSGFCQCKAGSLFLRESNTCSPDVTNRYKRKHLLRCFIMSITNQMSMNRIRMIWRDLTFTIIYTNQSTFLFNQTMTTSHNMAWVMMTIVI